MCMSHPRTQPIPGWGVICEDCPNRQDHKHNDHRSCKVTPSFFGRVSVGGKDMMIGDVLGKDFNESCSDYPSQ